MGLTNCIPIYQIWAPSSGTFNTSLSRSLSSSVHGVEPRNIEVPPMHKIDQSRVGLSSQS